MVISALGVALPLETVADFLASMVHVAVSFCALLTWSSKMPLVYENVSLETYPTRIPNLLDHVGLFSIRKLVKASLEAGNDFRGLLHSVSVKWKSVPSRALP